MRPMGGWLRVLLGTDAGFTADTAAWGERTGSYPDYSVGFRMADVNGDGLADVVYETQDRALWVLLSMGSSFAPSDSWGGRTYDDRAHKGTFQLADVNGDGMADVVYAAALPTEEPAQLPYAHPVELRVLLSTGFSEDSSWGLTSEETCLLAMKTVDVNGDGRADILYYKNNILCPEPFSTTDLNGSRVLS